MSGFKNFIGEVHRRSLWQVLGIYLIGAWLAYEVILGLTEGGVLPEWFPGVAVGAFIVGLPIVLATAFVQEGVGRAGGPDSGGPAESAAQRSAPPPPAGPTTAGDAGEAPASSTPAAASHTQWTSASPRPTGTVSARLERFLTWRKAVAGGVFVFVVAGLVALTASMLGSPGDSVELAGERSLAVLPLENMSPDPDDAYFSAGIHEEIITRLFRIGQIRTLARASVVPFAGSERSLESIAGELGVNYLLVGSVRRAGEQSRVSMALVDPRSGQQLWADTYEATGTDVFAVQASIARNVASALEAELTPGTDKRLALLPTASSAAYDDYLRGRAALDRSYGRESTGAAIESLTAAVEADPQFALAHAYLAIAHLQYYWFHYDHSDERRALALDHVRRALLLDPGLPEGHLAMARYHYWGHLDYDDALAELELAAEGLPSDPEIYISAASIHRRAGRMEEAVENYLKGIERDPRYWHGWWNLAETYNLLRQYDAAFDAAAKALEAGMNPGDIWAFKAQYRLRGLADPRGAVATLDSVPSQLATGEYDPLDIRVEALSWLGEVEEALAATDTIWIRTQFVVRPPSLMRALVHVRTGNTGAAMEAFDTARIEMEAALEERPDDVRLLGALGIALAGAGEPDRGVDLAQRSVTLLPPEREAWRGVARLEDLAIASVLAGRESAAVELLERILSRPYTLSREAIAADPLWAPLRDRPDFQRLVSDDG